VSAQLSLSLSEPLLEEEEEIVDFERLRLSLDLGEGEFGFGFGLPVGAIATSEISLALNSDFQAPSAQI
tara:strand:+ start:523 stop:729 length:207 start_codon:yes stop_codon:yes gene_type:complete